jgi:hypothetical protein
LTRDLTFGFHGSPLNITGFPSVTLSERNKSLKEGLFYSSLLVLVKGAEKAQTHVFLIVLFFRGVSYERQEAGLRNMVT